MGILALVLVAIGGTVTAYVMEEAWPAAVALVAAAPALILLVIPRQRRSVASGQEGRDDEAESADVVGSVDVEVEAEAGGAPAPQSEPDVVAEPEVRVAPERVAEAGVSGDAGEEAMVLVVRGRRRYHGSDCALVADLDVEEIHVDEAKAEGFTACSKCQ